jgi:hypothetical protein
MDEPLILIVRHRIGRGLSPHHMGPALRHLQQHRPDVHRRLVFHRTNKPTPSLERIGAVVFWLRDPLRVRSPDCYAQAVRIAEAAKRRSIRLINPPDVLSDFGKSRQARLWRQAGIPTPDVERFETLESLRDGAARLDFPLMIRADEEHKQHGARVVNDRDALLNLTASQLVFPCAVSPLIDVRSGYRVTAPNSAFAKLFHKKRLIVANDAIRTKHTLFSENPIVCASTSLFASKGQFWGFESPFPLLPLHKECVAHDLAYWQREEEHSVLMRKACGALGLSYAAIDYSNLADGTPILWEANPVFAMPQLKDIMLPRRRRAAERIESYYGVIGKFLNELLATASQAQVSEFEDRRRRG